MSSIANSQRRYTASGREIEPDFVAPPVPPAAQPGEGIAIRIRGLEKSFGDTAVLKGIDLDIAAGSFVAIVGKSGCGKSTLLRLLTGLEQPSGGSISFGGAAASETAPNSRIMFQEPRLLPWEKVAENVGVGLGRDRDDGRVHAALADVQLSEKAKEWPSRLSGGQRQRVSLARALVSRPDFLALDEPLGALDALTRITMQKLLEHVWRDQGFTALLVTHDVGEAVALADRVIVLDGGDISLDLAIDLDRPRQQRFRRVPPATNSNCSRRSSVQPDGPAARRSGYALFLPRQRPSTVDDQHVTGNEAAGVAGEILVCGGDVLGAADASDRLRDGRRFDPRLSQRVDGVQRLRRADDARRDGVDGDSRRPELRGERADHANDAGLGGGVVGVGGPCLDRADRRRRCQQTARHPLPVIGPIAARNKRQTPVRSTSSVFCEIGFRHFPERGESVRLRRWRSRCRVCRSGGLPYRPDR